MKKCTDCGRHVIFRSLSPTGLCPQCQARKAREYKEDYERRKQEEYLAAILFVDKMTPYVRRALFRSTVFPAQGKESLLKQKADCDYVVANIDNWKKYPYIREAIIKTSTYNSRGERVSPILDGARVSQDGIIDLHKEFARVKEKASLLSTDCYLASLKAYDYSKVVTVVGVTFSNGRRKRQTILRQIRFRDPPYETKPEIRLEKQAFENEEAIAVYANEEQVGYISRGDLPFFLEHWDEYSHIDEFDVTGSYDLNFGMNIRVCFVKK